MTQDLGFLKEMKFSNSSITAFQTCPQMFKLIYIDAEERIDNFFGQFGLLIHDILELYFNRDADIFELSSLYEEKFPLTVTCPPPPYPAGMKQNYYDDGLEFFENFSFDRNSVDVILTEEFLEFDQDGYTITTKPDMVVKEKGSGKIILVDYKTSKLKLDGKSLDKKKEAGYLRQMELYAYGLWAERNIKTDKIWIWYVRNNLMKTYPIDIMSVQETLEWAGNTIKQIAECENDWLPPTKTKPGKFWCDFICSVRDSCPFKI